MKILISKTEKTVRYNFGKFQHNVTYKADDTNTTGVKIESLEDQVLTMAAKDVMQAPNGKLSYDGSQIVANGISIGADFDTIVTDLQAIITSIETGVEVVEVPFPVEAPVV